MDFEEWFEKQIKNGIQCILIGEQHDSLGISEDCVKSILKIQKKLGLKIDFFNENLKVVNDNSTVPYNKKFLEELPQSNIIKLFLNAPEDIKIYGLESKKTNPFDNLNSVEEIAECLVKLDIDVPFDKDKDNVDSYYMRALMAYGNSLHRFKLGNQFFCDIISEEKNKNEKKIIVVQVGCKHLPSITQNSIIVEPGMIERLGGEEQVSSCFIKRPSKTQTTQIYEPKSDRLGTYGKINCCIVPTSYNFPLSLENSKNDNNDDDMDIDPKGCTIL